MNPIVAEVQKPLTERGWKRSGGHFSVPGSDYFQTPIAAMRCQAFEDQPKLIAGASNG